MIERFPLISIIIPTYNRSYIISRTIDSVANQTYPNIEIIIVDDGSTDNTEEVMNLMKQKYNHKIKYIKNTNNSNGAVARNVGIDEAKGEFIAFLDSDDYWDATKIEKQYNQIVNELKNNENINFVSYTQLIADRGKAKNVLPRCGKDDDESIGEYLFKNNGLMQTSTLMLPTVVAKQVKFNQNLKKHQDWDFCLRLEQYGAKFIFINEPLSYWDISDRKDRVSNENDYIYSLNWIRENYDKVSKKAYYAFLGKIVATHAGRSGKRIYAIKLCLKGFFKKSVSIKDLFTTLIKILLPVKILYRMYNIVSIKEKV